MSRCPGCGAEAATVLRIDHQPSVLANPNHAEIPAKIHFRGFTGGVVTL